VVLIQPIEAADLSAVEEACAASGFERTPEESPAHAILGSDSVKRGFDTVTPLSAWQKTASDGQLALEGETTPDVDDLVGVVNSVAAVRSLSATFDLNDDSDLGLFLRADYAELEKRARDELARDPGSASRLAALVEVLVARGTLDEAAEKARALTALHDNAESWRTLGRVEIRMERWPDAAAAFERALELDPLAGNAMIMLAHCYSQLGDEGKAQLLRARATALGSF
jgi:tetratricopeptide (TPR) repeat protein